MGQVRLFFPLEPRRLGRVCSPDLFHAPPPRSAFARIENHYFINDGFMREGQLLDQQEIDKMYVALSTCVAVSESEAYARTTAAISQR
jgi:hypothetical protein